jgi:hypothetical protein
MPYPNPFIIGITGFKRSGKDTVASLIHSQLPKHQFPVVIRRGFADALKQDVAEILGADLKHLEANKKHPLIRHLFQWYGTDFCRKNSGDDIWIQHMHAFIADLDIKTKRYCLIIPDVRFVNEATWVQDNDGVVLRVERKGQTSDDPHPSEQELMHIKHDFRIDNNGESMPRLLWEVRCVLSFIYEKYGHFKATSTSGTK